MKTFTICIAMLALSFSAFSQEEEEIRTLLGDDLSHGGFLGLTSGYSLIDHQDAVLIGGQLCWVLDHSLAIGIGGNGFVNNLSGFDELTSSEYHLDGGYGGVYFSPILFATHPIHLAFPVTLGAGGLALTETWYTSSSHSYDGYLVDSDAFLVAEPGIEVELNLVKFMRVAFGAHYRFTTGVHITGTPTDAMNGFSGTFSLRLGWF